MKPRPPGELQIPFDRVTYREGQLLASRDLQDDFQANQRLRRMHTLFLHATWGIGLGFTVNAQIADDTVQVGPGYAIDRSAREILLSETVALPVPNTATASDLMLVIGYQPDSAYQALPGIATLCAGAGLDPRRERPAFNWRTPDTLKLGVDVPLAKVRVQNGALTQMPDLSVRRYAARMTRPHMATGSMEFAPDASELHGIPVDTSGAGFANTPEYFVRLDAAAGGALEWVAQFIANNAYVLSATAKGFTYVIPGIAAFVNPFAPSPLRFTITWVGVEPVTGCQPVSNPYHVFNSAGFPVVHQAGFKKGGVA